MRAHQPGSTPIDIPETVPNPAYTPAPAPERAPTKVPEKVPEKVISGIAEVTATSNGGLNPKLLISGSPFDRFEIGGQDSRLAEAAIQRLLAPPADHFCLANGGSKTKGSEPATQTAFGASQRPVLEAVACLGNSMNLCARLTHGTARTTRVPRR